ncbi:serine/threonine protein kinase [Streptomyces sp. 4N509B]|uniref:serine/threonine protein kinase n=1 Tax=Streptomyces sp. 4N509B TaxID=3457413 RepID=UPI003FCEF68D
MTFRALAPGDPARVGPYRIVGRLGQGGMGSVYLGQSRGGRMVAVKVIREDLADDAAFRRRFRREVDAARRVNGVFTAGVVDADPSGDPPWLATAYVPGLSLDEAVRSRGGWPETAVLALAAGLAEALEAIHAAGVVHRDLKPSNVILAEDGPRVIDFGIAGHVDAHGNDTASVTVAGSLGYMAPEQLTGAGIVPATDVFALGAVLAFVATGTEVFGTGMSAVFRTTSEEPDLSGLPPRLRGLVARCLTKEPAGRPSVSELVEELAEFVGAPWLPAPLAGPVAAAAAASPPPAARTPTEPARDPSPQPRRATPAVIGLAVVVVAAVVGLVTWLVPRVGGDANASASPSVSSSASESAGASAPASQPATDPRPLPSPTRSPTPSPEEEPSVVGVWEGSYRCALGLVALDLTITSPGGDALEALFVFSPHPDNPGTPSGSFSMVGSLRDGVMVLRGDRWIDEPEDFSFVDLEAEVPAGTPDRLHGDVSPTGDGAPGCTSFAVERQD